MGKETVWSIIKKALKSPKTSKSTTSPNNTTTSLDFLENELKTKHIRNRQFKTEPNEVIVTCSRYTQYNYKMYEHNAEQPKYCKSRASRNYKSRASRNYKSRASRNYKSRASSKLTENANPINIQYKEIESQNSKPLTPIKINQQIPLLPPTKRKLRVIKVEKRRCNSL
jgi:predicted metal-dependent hydrolase